MNNQEIAKLLDWSCADALRKWGQGRRIDRKKAFEAMTALEGELKRYKMPNYEDDYIPPAYVISYQLGHVYMAWNVLSWTADTLKKWSWNPLRIVDLGSGTSAGRIGAALMVAEAIEKNHSIEHVIYEEIDISAPMQAMGELVWRAFAQRVQLEFPNSNLAHAVNIIDSRQYSEWNSVKGGSSETWLTAFHVMYKEQNMQEIVRTLYNQVKPIAGAFSCHKGNLNEMRYVFPFRPATVWNSGNYPPHEGQTASEVRCETFHTIRQAGRFGFRTWRQRNWRPFLQVKDCAILLGIDY